jgi:pimeloyl-ACP methyl ester carboxylesterase
MLPLLDDPSGKHPSFHVVAPSLPGFGFSDAPEKTGFGLVQFAEVRLWGQCSRTELTMRP